jgi:hypothetical protein
MKKAYILRMRPDSQTYEYCYIVNLEAPNYQAFSSYMGGYTVLKSGTGQRPIPLKRKKMKEKKERKKDEERRKKKKTCVKESNSF